MQVADMCIRASLGGTYRTRNYEGPWTDEEKDALKACVATYKARIRPLVREADLYHVFPRPDGRSRDGIEYYDPVAGKGVVYLFQPSGEAQPERIRLKGLDPRRTYRIEFEDGTQPSSVKPAAELMDNGLPVTLEGDELSELIFFTDAATAPAQPATEPSAAER